MSRLLPTAVAIGIILVAGVLLGDFGQNTYANATDGSYPIGFHGAQWIRDSETAPRTWFRLYLPISEQPSSAVLWIDAEQEWSLTVDGTPVQSNAGDVSARSPHTVGIDVTPLLTSGDHVIGVVVVNMDRGKPAGLIARLTTNTGGVTTDQLTGPAPWTVTSDAHLVYQPPHLSATTFAMTSAPVAGWRTAAAGPSMREPYPSHIPEWALADPLREPALYASDYGATLRATATVTLPGRAGDAWLRVVAAGPVALLVNGDTLFEGPLSLRPAQPTPSPTPGPATPASQPTPGSVTGPAVQPSPGAQPTPKTGRAPKTNPRPVPAVRPLAPSAAGGALFHLAPFFHQGWNTITVVNRHESTASVYVDGSIAVDGRDVALTNLTWQGGAADGGGSVDAVSATGQIWERPALAAIPATGLSDPFGRAWVGRIEGAGLVLAIALILALTVGRMTTRGPLAALADIGVLLLPIVAVIELVDQMGHFVDIAPPGVFRPPVFALLCFLAMAAMMVSVTSSQALVATAARSEGLRRSARKLVAVRASRSLRGVLARNRLTIAIGGLAATLGAGMAFDLGYEPFWQDELYTIAAAQGMRSHWGLPIWSSGFQYWKSELFTMLVAIVGGITNDNQIVLRGISVIFYILTVVAFGRYLVPIVIGREHPWLQWLATAVFATAPAELRWAREVRMYQMAQFMLIVLMVVLYHALRSPTKRGIAWSAALIVLMYLTHEETFIVFPAIAAVALLIGRTRVVTDRRWVIAGAIAAAIIGAQYVLTIVSHPPILGYDSSNRPAVQLSTWDPFYYLQRVYFQDGIGTRTVVTLFAVAATIIGVVRRSVERLYLAAFAWLPLLVLSFVFTGRNNRYSFMLIPPLMLLAVIGVSDVVKSASATLSSRLHIARRVTIAPITAFTLTSAFIALALTMSSSPQDYNLAMTRLTGSPQVAERYDYDFAGRYVQQHWQPGDVLVTHCPPNIAAYYTSRTPDYIIQPRTSGRLLYIFEQGGKPVDTQYGVPVILASTDLQRVMERHQRVWIIGDTRHHVGELPVGFRDLINSNFGLVAEGQTSDVYLFDR